MNDHCLTERLAIACNPADAGTCSPIPQPSAVGSSRQVYIQKGRLFAPTDPTTLDLREILPPGTYTIGTSDTGYYLEQVDDFTLPVKLYGDVDANARRILNTFLVRPSGTGVLLSGNKGSGKTMLAKRIAQLALHEHGMITILISRPLCGEAFNIFLQGISQPAVVIFDEFEKVYDRETQPKLLTIFDGTYPSKKLFILTCNDGYRVDAHMHNRPGRLFYAIEYGGLDAAFIREYCAANLLRPEHASGVLNVGAIFSDFSFDMLKALVEEMNRYGETATQAMRMLNIKPQADAGLHYSIKVLRNGQELKADMIHPSSLNRSPLSLFDKLNISLLMLEEEGSGQNQAAQGRRKARSDRPDRCEEFSLTTTDLLSVDIAKGTFVFKTDRADTEIVFTRQEKPATAIVNYDAF